MDGSGGNETLCLWWGEEEKNLPLKMWHFSWNVKGDMERAVSLRLRELCLRKSKQFTWCLQKGWRVHKNFYALLLLTVPRFTYFQCSTMPFSEHILIWLCYCIFSITWTKQKWGLENTHEKVFTMFHKMKLLLSNVLVFSLQQSRTSMPNSSTGPLRSLSSDKDKWMLLMVFRFKATTLI